MGDSIGVVSDHENGYTLKTQQLKASDRQSLAVVGLLALGKSDFEAMEAFRQDRLSKKSWACPRR